MSNKSRVSVEVRNGNINGALKYFNKKVMESGILQEYKDNQEFIKPSTRKRKKRKDTIRERKRQERR